MKALFLTILLSTSMQLLLSQEQADGVVSFTLPVRNSLMFNRYALNPTFSFVREQYKYASVYNKRELVQFNDAPLTYLASYSGRFAENIGAGIGLFQQNYGVLTTFGGLLNFAYNARLNRDNNLTFGLNLGAYSSGINTGNTTTNFTDPSLQNVPSNFLITVSPGINYGTTFFDFGVSLNNLFVYNLESSSMLEEDPNQGIQGHVMYTGYISSRGFFDDARFSGLFQSEFTKDETILSANALIYVPKGLWFQAGYNTRFGVSAGAGINITKEIAIEYSFEKTLGDLIDFGPSHEITLAYRFQSRRYFDYSRQDEVSGLISTKKKPKRYVAKTSKPKRTVITPTVEETPAKATPEDVAKQKAEADRVSKLAEEKKKQEEAEKLALLEKQKAEKAEQERIEEQKRIAREKINAQKREQELAEKREQERLAKLEAEKQAQELAAERERERLKKIEDERLAKLKEEQERERAEAEKLVEQEQVAKEKLEAEKQNQELITNPKDTFGKELLKLAKVVEENKEKQDDLLEKFNEAVEGKNDNLRNLKEENDLSEQGIVVRPKEFKSVTKENERLKSIKSDLDKILEERTERIKELEERYEDMTEADTIVNETVMLYYRKELEKLKTEQSDANDIRLKLENKLEAIEIGIEFEKRRRIKRAEYDNEEERYTQDRARLQTIKNTTEIGNKELNPEDFDFGLEQSTNIKILKNVNYTDSGYYMVLAVHTDTDKRDEFITKAMASGATNIDFFYDVNTSQYYIYQNKLESIGEANSTLKQRGTKAYNSKMTIIKIEN
ncbi:type IX secretion system PorP/SprF family membrane protein [Winogradskyella wandonensis]|uniref:Type IX secretion system PorP/SprF family membrane protein n=1 Tax=Winogradskyella wandonensis TaxID=1442586 RepID=A0A4R1KVS0_9FLAO|nr:type IX secretion system membrane protein PorP/SprF [Winogradskyella wandonensis]TCK69292.1 type IX secretion system PorP/SprF family membrane protein [Winogradskyella wandonensis]